MLIKLGRSLFGIAIAFFGIQHFIYMLNVKGPIAGPPWIVGRPFWAYLMGAVLVIAGVSIVARVKVRLAGISLAALLFLYVLFLYVPGLLTHIHDPGRWTSAAELVAMSGAAMVLAGSNGIERTHRPSNSITNDIGRLLFAIPFVVFGIQHLLYANFVAMLVPSWIPGHLFWAYFIGIAFIAASLSM
ncbi:MAG TPA: hypothetical protein VFA74_16085, partial [Terriglobales bacterium]|nr:hypothetical protein [Terriglobales bacterium]